MPGKDTGSRACSKLTYRRAAALTGKTIPELRLMAQQVFASMLYHVMDRPGSFVWTIAEISGTRMAELRLRVRAVEVQQGRGRP